MKCSNCGREAAKMGTLCCTSCPGGSHTPECNVATFPDQPGAKYYYDPDAGSKLLDRMKRAVALTEVLEKEVREISNVMRGLGLTPEGTLDSLAAHLCIDLQYVGAELKRILK